MATDPEDSLVFLVVNVQDVNYAAQVTYTEIEDHDRLIDRAVVVLDDPVGSVGDVPREGQTVTIELGWATEHAVLFEGEIVRVVTEARDAGSRQVTLVAFDPSYQLMQGSPKTRDHTGTLSSILQAIAGEYSLPVGQIQLDPDPSFTPDTPLRQMNKKDWAFIQEATRLYRSRAFVEYNDGASKFYAVSEAQLLQGDVMGSLSYAGGPGQLVEFRYQRIAGSAAAQRSAITIHPDTGEIVSAPAGPPPEPEPPPEPDPVRRDALHALGRSFASDYGTALEQAAKAATQPDKQRPIAVVAGLPSDPNLPGQLARTDPTRTFGLHGDGLAVGTVNLRAKGKVGIAGVANWADGDWYVQQVNHIIADKAYWTRFVVTR